MMEENLSKKSKAELVELVQTLDAKVAEITAQLQSAQKEKEDLRQRLVAAAAAAETQEKMLEAAKNNAATVITDSTPALQALLAKAKGAIAELREIISLSCKDHCPHHQKPGACVNCGIKKRLDAVAEE